MQAFDSQQTAQLLPYAQLVPAVARAARELANGAINAPERLVVNIDANGVLLCMPAVAADIGVTKLITVHGDNARHGLPAIQGEVVVFDAATGKRLALLDGPTVTARRTAAVTLLGIQQLAAVKPATALLIGTGVQAATHAEALIEVLNIGHFRIASRTSSHAQAFCDALQRRYPQVAAMPVALADLAGHCQDVDLVIALTTAKFPVIPAQLRPDTLAVGVGAFKPEMAELPAELLHASTIIVDHLAGAMHEAGDLIRAQVDWSRVRELSDVLAHGAQAAPAPVFKSVGHAAWDLAAARVAAAAMGS